MIVWTWKFQRLCFPISGLCSFGQSYPKKMGCVDSLVTANASLSECSPMQNSIVTNLEMVLLLFIVPSVLYTGIDRGRLYVNISFSFTNVSSMADPLQPESTKATTGIFDLSLLMIIPCVSNELADCFLCTHFGLFCISWRENCTSFRDNHRICCMSLGVTSPCRLGWMNDLKCFSIWPSLVLSAISLIHLVHQGSTVFIQFCCVSSLLEVFSSLTFDICGFGGHSAASLLPFFGGRTAASDRFSGSVSSMLKREYLFCNDLKVGHIDDWLSTVLLENPSQPS